MIQNAFCCDCDDYEIDTEWCKVCKKSRMDVNDDECPRCNPDMYWPRKREVK